MTGRRWSGWAAGLAALAAALVLPAFIDAYTESLAITTAAFIVLALSWNLMAGFGGLMSFGLAGFFGIGGYVYGYLQQKTDLPIVVLLLAGGLVAFVAGVLLVPCFRARGIYFAILTLAVAESLRVLALNFFPGQDRGLFFGPSFDVRGLEAYWWGVGVVVFGVLACVLVRHSRLGHALAALKGDPEAAEASGVNTLLARTLVTLISSGLAGVAGAFFAATQSFVEPSTNFATNYSLAPLLMVVVGGMGTIVGPVIGAIGWQALDELLRSFVTSGQGGALSTMVYGALLVIFAVFVPNGLVGASRSLWGRFAAVRTPRRPGLPTRPDPDPDPEPERVGP